MIAAMGLVWAGCSATSSAPNKNSGDDAAGAGAAAARSGCDLNALGLGAAKPVAAWQPPPGCNAKGDTSRAVIPITTEAEFAAHFGCAAGVTSGIDFGRDHLMLQTRSLSPASIGGEIVDDGTTVTYVTHFRGTCPDEPRPMPMDYTVTYLLPTGATRTFADASCTLGGQPKCK